LRLVKALREASRGLSTTAELLVPYNAHAISMFITCLDQDTTRSVGGVRYGGPRHFVASVTDVPASTARRTLGQQLTIISRRVRGAAGLARCWDRSCLSCTRQTSHASSNDTVSMYNSMPTTPSSTDSVIQAVRHHSVVISAIV